MLTLYTAPRSRATRILWLLEELGVPYERKNVSIRRGDGSGARDPANPHPHGKVPAIVHDGTLVFETTAITLYLTDAFPAAGLGPRAGDPTRAAYLSWLAYYSGVIEPSLTAKFLKIEHIFGTFGWAPFDEVVDYLSKTLVASPYLLGDTFSAADLVIGGSLPILMKAGLILDAEPFQSYVGRLTGRPAYQRAMEKDAG